MRAAPGASAHMQLCSRTGQPCRPTLSGSSLSSSGGSSSRRAGCWEQQPSGASSGAGPPRHQRQPRRSLARVCAIAVPGPLFMGSDFDRERFRDLKATQPFLTFPVRLDDAASLRTTPPLVRCACRLLPAWPLLPVPGATMCRVYSWVRRQQR